MIYITTQIVVTRTLLLVTHIYVYDMYLYVHAYV
jgi:hypothetical protein